MEEEYKQQLAELKSSKNADLDISLSTVQTKLKEVIEESETKVSSLEGDLKSTKDKLKLVEEQLHASQTDGSGSAGKCIELQQQLAVANTKVVLLDEKEKMLQQLQQKFDNLQRASVAKGATTEAAEKEIEELKAALSTFNAALTERETSTQEKMDTYEETVVKLTKELQKAKLSEVRMKEFDGPAPAPTPAPPPPAAAPAAPYDPFGEGSAPAPQASVESCPPQAQQARDPFGQSSPAPPPPAAAPMDPFASTPPVLNQVDPFASTPPAAQPQSLKVQQSANPFDTTPVFFHSSFQIDIFQYW